MGGGRKGGGGGGGYTDLLNQPNTSDQADMDKVI